MTMESVLGSAIGTSVVKVKLTPTLVQSTVVKVKVTFTLVQSTKAQRGSRGIGVHLL